MEMDSQYAISRNNEDVAYRALLSFNEKNAKVFKFPELVLKTKQRLIYGTMYWLNVKSRSCMKRACLETIRVVSRDKNGLDSLVNPDLIDCLVRHAGLTSRCIEIDASEEDYKVIFEAQQSLCNVIYNSNTAQHICSNNGSIDGIVQRLKTYKDIDIPNDIKLLDIRILFLLTSLCSDIRTKVRNDLHGMTYLIEVLDLTLRTPDHHTEGTLEALTDQQITLCSEILKILYNLTVTIDRNNMDEEEEAHFMRLVSILHELLVCEVKNPEKQDTLISNTVNLLTNMPRSSYEELLTPLPVATRSIEVTTDEPVENEEFDGKSMEAIVSLLRFLDNRLQSNNANLMEELGPVLHCLIEICVANRSIRRFCRIKVLPHLVSTDVARLPEEGSTLRNRMCKLLSCLVSEVKVLAAEFLFVLCRENVPRFIKYTGYGNAAGLLAQRGLLCGGIGSRGSNRSDGGASSANNSGGGDYSSESDSSDTEEYSMIKDSINPITGRYETLKEDIMKDMSDEQKEHEAMKLVAQIDKLQRDGFIKPARVGEDGTPQPVDHILQLIDDDGK